MPRTGVTVLVKDLYLSLPERLYHHFRLLSSPIFYVRCFMSSVQSATMSLYLVCTIVFGTILSCSVLRLMNEDEKGDTSSNDLQFLPSTIPRSPVFVNFYPIHLTLLPSKGQAESLAKICFFQCHFA